MLVQGGGRDHDPHLEFGETFYLLARDPLLPPQCAVDEGDRVLPVALHGHLGARMLLNADPGDNVNGEGSALHHAGDHEPGRYISNSP